MRRRWNHQSRKWRGASAPSGDSRKPYSDGEARCWTGNKVWIKRWKDLHLSRAPAPHIGMVDGTKKSRDTHIWKTNMIPFSYERIIFCCVFQQGLDQTIWWWLLSWIEGWDRSAGTARLCRLTWDASASLGWFTNKCGGGRGGCSSRK